MHLRRTETRHGDCIVELLELNLEVMSSSALFRRLSDESTMLIIISHTFFQLDHGEWRRARDTTHRAVVDHVT